MLEVYVRIEEDGDKDFVRGLYISAQHIVKAEIEGSARFSVRFTMIDGLQHTTDSRFEHYNDAKEWLFQELSMLNCCHG